MSLMSLVGVRQVFAGRTVLDVDHLDLVAGTCYALQGPNGSGKTTLLQVLAFLRRPTHGEIRFNGKRVDWREKTMNALRRRVVLVDQHPIMFSTTVRNNVEFGLRMRGIPSRSRRRLAEESLAMVGLADLADRPAHLLSGGETQRAAIARALACAPEIMLFDEPTASVDVENQCRIESLIRDIGEAHGITVIFSTHRRLEAIRLAERRIFLVDGRLVQAGGENVLSGRVVIKNGTTVCLVGPWLEFPVISARLGEVKVVIDPQEIRVVSLEKGAVWKEDRSSVCRCTGVIDEMRAEKEKIMISVDVSFPLKVLLSRQEAEERRFVVGDSVMVEIELQAFQLIQ